MQLSKSSSGLVGLDFCGTIFSKQSLSDVAYFWMFGNFSCLVQKHVKYRYISKLIQLLFLFATSNSTRNNSIERYSEKHHSCIDKMLLNKYFIDNSKDEVFVASGSIYELIQLILAKNGVRCKIIAASINTGMLERFKNFYCTPWIGAEKVRRIIMNYPWISERNKLRVFETDSHNDDPVANITEFYILKSQNERFGCNN